MKTIYRTKKFKDATAIAILKTDVPDQPVYIVKDSGHLRLINSATKKTYSVKDNVYCKNILTSPNGLYCVPVKTSFDTEEQIYSTNDLTLFRNVTSKDFCEDGGYFVDGTFGADGTLYFLIQTETDKVYERVYSYDIPTHQIDLLYESDEKIGDIIRWDSELDGLLFIDRKKGVKVLQNKEIIYDVNTGAYSYILYSGKLGGFVLDTPKGLKIVDLQSKEIDHVNFIELKPLDRDEINDEDLGKRIVHANQYASKAVLNVRSKERFIGMEKSLDYLFILTEEIIEQYFVLHVLSLDTLKVVQTKIFIKGKYLGLDAFDYNLALYRTDSAEVYNCLVQNFYNEEDEHEYKI